MSFGNLGSILLILNIWIYSDDILTVLTNSLHLWNFFRKSRPNTSYFEYLDIFWWYFKLTGLYKDDTACTSRKVYVIKFLTRNLNPNWIIGKYEEGTLIMLIFRFSVEIYAEVYFTSHEHVMRFLNGKKRCKHCFKGHVRSRILC